MRGEEENTRKSDSCEKKAGSGENIRGPLKGARWEQWGDKQELARRW